MEKVDIYDFDKTVVPFDSAMKYWGFSMVHCPWILVLLPFQFVWGMMMLTHIISVRTCKRWCFTFINLINNKKNVKKFWDKYEKYVFDWFKKENRARKTVLISASPDFLIDEIAKRLDVEYVLATQISAKGIMIGEVCRKDEKVKRFRTILPDAEVEDVFSDNPDHDRYIFSLGKRCFLATNGKLEQIDISTYDFNKKKKKLCA